MSKRVIMRTVLKREPNAQASGVRPFSTGDRERLGALLFDAYLGTIDQEEDTIEQAQAEVEKTINGEYGDFLPGSSMVVERSRSLLSATLLTRFHNRPFIAFSFTSPDSKNQGLARACIRASMLNLIAEGEIELHLVVTLENAPAVHLYKSLGFEVERDV